MLRAIKMRTAEQTADQSGCEVRRWSSSWRWSAIAQPIAMDWQAMGKLQSTLRIRSHVGQMLQRVPFFGGQSQGRVAAVFDRDFVISLLSTRQIDVNFFDPSARADDHFNGLAAAVCQEDF
jgi:hypothetical protein